MSRLIELYRHTEVRFAQVLEGRAKLAALTAKSGIVEKPAGPIAGPFASPLGYAAQQRAYFSAVTGAAAQSLADPDGPRVGALSLTGWDTHYQEGISSGTLALLLGALDDALAAIKDKMGAAWRETVVMLITEFGRTARINGSKGTDHGTATVALAVGGALKGGRVIADWPGLSRPVFWRIAISNRPPTCARCSKACCRITCAPTSACLRATCFPAVNE